MRVGRDRWTIEGDAAIEVVRDAHGVPRVRAATEADLYRGLGYCHATDRALQMLLTRIITLGRASEHFEASDEMLRSDRFFRRMNLGADAPEETAKLPPGDRALADAYCDGVNRALARRVPWELRLVGYRPAPWTIAHSLTLSRTVGYVALAQSQGDMERLLVEMVQAGVPRAHLEALFPNQLQHLDVALIRGIVLGERVVPAAVRWGTIAPRAVASNNWVVAPRKSASGHALLANDPHLETGRLPAIWYEVVLELGERFCIAATMPGLPGALLGRSNDLAWGATYAFADAIDSWVEDCRNGCYRRVYEDGDRWVPFRVRTEVIKRKRKPDVTVVFHENEHGVLDGDPTTAGLRLATRWSAGADTGAVTLSASFAMLRAPDVTAGMRELGRFETAWNWVLADRHGNIGYQMSGRIPIRGGDASGIVPLPGWDPANDWQGFVAPSDLPRAVNPEAGFLATANDDLNHLGSTHPINLPMGSYRAERIAELLAERDDWSVTSTLAMQLDVYSPQAVRFMAVLGPLLPAGPAGILLRDWDCHYDVHSKGAVLFERFYRELLVEVFGTRCGSEVLRYVTGDTGIVVDFYANFDRVLLDPDSIWFGLEGQRAVFARVAARALAGPVTTWGSEQRLPMRHLLLGGRVPRWLGLDRGPIALAGGRATIRQGQIYRAGGRATSFAPSYRLVTDFGEPRAHTALAGGPSDRPFSPWYASELDGWLEGRAKTIAAGSCAST